MIFSVHTDQHIKDAGGVFGYSYGYDRIKKHFSEFIYRKKTLEVVENSPFAKFQMFYMEPEWYDLRTMKSLRSLDFKKHHDHQYKIIGTHLEADKVWTHWIDTMNSVDEIWVGNQFAKDAVLNSGITTPTYVFEHGIDSMWKPRKRGENTKIRFLHIDSGSPRKRADLVEKAFLSLFRGNMGVELTLKYHSHEGSSTFGVMKLFNEENENVKKIYETISQKEMVELFYNHDVLVYPSEGEGFGFIPLQALCTGMPVISTGRWCSYEKYLDGNIIDSTMGKTTYTGYFEGNVVLADFDSLVYHMKNVYDNIDSQCDFFYDQASSVYEEYNWTRRVSEFMTPFVKRVGMSSLYPIDEESFIKGKYVMYTGNGSFCTKDGIIFNNKDRIKLVPKEIYENLIFQDSFTIPTKEQIKTGF
jgi:glycosyltransferase involved in cell wall biosynthesis